MGNDTNAGDTNAGDPVTSPTDLATQPPFEGKLLIASELLTQDNGPPRAKQSYSTWFISATVKSWQPIKCYKSDSCCNREKWHNEMNYMIQERVILYVKVDLKKLLYGVGYGRVFDCRSRGCRFKSPSHCPLDEMVC